MISKVFSNHSVFPDLKLPKLKTRLWDRRRSHSEANVCLFTTHPNAEPIPDPCQRWGRKVNTLQIRFCANCLAWSLVVEMKDRLIVEPEG